MQNQDNKENSLENTQKYNPEHTLKRTPMNDFNRLAAIARNDRPPLMRADVAVIRRRLSLSSQRNTSSDERMPAALMIFSSAFTGLAACAVVAVMLQMTHDVSLSTQAGTAQTPATQVGLTPQRSGQLGTQGSPGATAQASAQARNTSVSGSIDPVADLFEPLQLDLP